MKNRCVIVAGGDCCETELMLITPNDFVIAADSGLKALLGSGLKPDLLVGDFDSYRGALPTDVETIRLPERKDDTDLLFAARMGIERGFKKFLILGGYGSRPDQNFAMYATLLWLVKSGDDITAWDVGNGFEVTALHNGEIAVRVEGDDYLSVFAFGGDAVGVCIKNADYELDNATLVPDFPIGVSNCAPSGTDVVISVKNGSLLIFKVKKNI